VQLKEVKRQLLKVFIKFKYCLGNLHVNNNGGGSSNQINYNNNNIQQNPSNQNYQQNNNNMQIQKNYPQQNNNQNNNQNFNQNFNQQQPVKYNSNNIPQNSNLLSPIKKDEMHAFDTEVYSEEQFKELEQNGKVCIICLEPYSNKIEQKKIGCGHIFCKNCIMKCAEINPYCPVCRFQIDFDKEFNNGVRRVQPQQLNQNQQMNVQFQQQPQQQRIVYTGNNNNWNIHTLRNIFAVDPYFNRGNVNIFTTRFGHDNRFNQARVINPFFNNNPYFSNMSLFNTGGVRIINNGGGLFGNNIYRGYGGYGGYGGGFLW